jgi:2'-5' RNA ligase
MGRIAVDVVLLPDKAMTNRAIELNRRLVTDSPPAIVLSAKDCRPHISLAMGGLEEADITAVQPRLEALAQETTVRALRIVDVVNSPNSRGGTTCLLEVEKADELQTLHERVMQEMRPWFTYDVTEAMFHDDEVAPSTLDWVRTYPQQAGYEHFHPHITIGYGRVPTDLSLPISFTVARLALCHLGNHCTCRKIVGEWNIGMRE